MPINKALRERAKVLYRKLHPFRERKKLEA